MPRLKGSLQKKPTKNADKVPDDHKCIRCKLGKEDVNFRVNVGFAGLFHPETICNSCRPHTRRRSIIKPTRREALRKEFKDYFEKTI